jgi:hypothetical protein
MKGDGDDAMWFRFMGKQRWKDGPVRLVFSPPDATGSRLATTLLPVPEGCSGIYLQSMDPVAGRGLSFDGLAVFNIKH